jgi:hypothetical protein
MCELSINDTGKLRIITSLSNTGTRLRKNETHSLVLLIRNDLVGVLFFRQLAKRSPGLTGGGHKLSEEMDPISDFT